MKTKIDFKVIDPLDIYIDPRCTHLERRWWHKLMFWKKFVYAEDGHIKIERLSLKDMIDQYT